VTGNPDIHDHWDDIAGYAKLVSQRIGKVEEPAFVTTMNKVQQLMRQELGERNILGGKAARTEQKEPFGYQEDRENVVTRRPHVCEASEPWLGEQIPSGSCAGALWSTLYLGRPESTLLRMYDVYRNEYEALRA
jgi:hypothetical protein